MSNLSSITTVRGPKPLRLVVYGEGGLGKTTFGCKAPKSVVIQTEDGLGDLEGQPAFPICTTWQEVTNCMMSLDSDEHDFKSVVFDSLDWLEPLINAEAAARNGWTSIDEPGYGKGPLAALEVWREFIAGLDHLRNVRGLTIILIAHAEIKTFADPTAEAYDRYQMKLSKGAAALLQEWADCVLFASKRVYIDKKDGGFGRKVVKATGSDETYMYTSERPGYRAKSRFPIPHEIKLRYPEFAAAIQASRETALQSTTQE